MDWLIWLEKKTYSGLNPKQQKIMDSIDSEQREDPYAKEVSVSEEQPLEKLTHGKLEEVEKLKAWEVFLDKTGNQYGKQNQKLNSTGGLGQDINYMGGTKQEPHTEPVPVSSPKGSLGGRPLKRKNPETGVIEKIPQPHKYTDNHANSATVGGGRHGGDKRGGNETHYGKVTMENTRAMLASVLGDKEDNPDEKLGNKPDTSNMPEWQKRIQARSGKIHGNAKKSWEDWLIKMQGAGDARFGNQHLTGLEQEPVADDTTTGMTTDGDKHDKPYKESSKKKDE
jgi:hypothetical protein